MKRAIPLALTSLLLPAVLADLLVSGEASRLYQGLVKGKELLLQVNGGVNWPLGDAWTYRGPSLLVLFGLYKPTTNAKAVVDAIGAEVARVAREGVPAAELERLKTKMKSDYYANLEIFINRADAIALAQLVGGDASFINEIPGKIDAVTAADLKRVALTYLTPANRTWVDRRPAAEAAAQK